MAFWVAGRDAVSGEPKRMLCDASTAEEAQEQARAQGVVPEAVEPADPPSEPIWPHPRREATPGSLRVGAGRVGFRILGIANILLGLWVLTSGPFWAIGLIQTLLTLLWILTGVALLLSGYWVLARRPATERRARFGLFLAAAMLIVASALQDIVLATAVGMNFSEGWGRITGIIIAVTTLLAWAWAAVLFAAGRRILLNGNKRVS